jgi:hypothetical protein
VPEGVAGCVTVVQGTLMTPELDLAKIDVMDISIEKNLEEIFGNPEDNPLAKGKRHNA